MQSTRYSLLKKNALDMLHCFYLYFSLYLHSIYGIFYIQIYVYLEFMQNWATDKNEYSNLLWFSRLLFHDLDN